MNKMFLKEWWFAITINILCIAFIIYILATVFCCSSTAPAMGENGPDTIPPIANPQYIDIGPYEMQKGDMKLYFGIENVVETFIEDNIYWCLYDDPDAFEDEIVIEMSKSTFDILEDIVERAYKYKPYSSEWCEIEEECTFILLYRKTCGAYILIVNDQA